MADHEITPTTPVMPNPATPAETNPLTPAAPAEHTLPAVDPKPLQNILDGLVEPAPKPGQPSTTDKPDEGDRKPLGDIANLP